MTSANRALRNWAGAVLVALQFGLIAVLCALAWPVLAQGRSGLGPWLLLGTGAALGGWSLASNRPGNFNVRPVPRVGGQLVQTGPYRWVRHSMYRAVMACAPGCVWVASSIWAWASLAALVAVLLVKSVLAERWMRLAHPGYVIYAQSTARFLPGLF